MRSQANTRKRVPGARSALGLLAVVCLSLSLQPCAMASGDDAGPPHCPPVNDHSGMSQTAAAQDSARLTVPSSASCSDCLLFGDYSRDARDGQVKLKNTQPVAPIAITDTNTALSYIHRTALRNDVRYRFATPGVSPPLNLLHCVYLK
jgi:hypothetical protein